MTAKSARAPGRPWSSLGRLFLESGSLLVCAAALQVEAMIIAEARAYWVPLPVLSAAAGLGLVSLVLFDEGGRAARCVGLALGLGTIAAAAFTGAAALLVLIGALGLPGLFLGSLFQ